MDHPEKIGKYEILAKIGEGGFGVVYKGRDPFIKRLVAVKTCSSDDETIRKRFFREAEIAGNLHHSNVVTLHDFGLEGETPFLVQEYLTGADLSVLIRDPPDSLTPERKLRILRSIAEGLHYAHGHGVIHRDIKPSNVRVLDDGRVKVMDFGIAKLRDQDSQLTQTGMTLGTIAYLSPEQLKGEAVDHRADIFSFGVLAYELLTGSRPFRADTISTLFFRLLHEEPTPIDDGALPAGLTDLVSHCLKKKPEDRFADFGEVIASIDDIAVALPGSFELLDPFFPHRAPAEPSPAASLATRAQQALERKDLTAAEMTLNIARRQVDGSTFEREFGHLVAELKKLKQSLAETSSAPKPAPNGEATRLDRGVAAADSGQLSADERLRLEGALVEIEQRIAALDFDAAAIGLTALEQHFPTRPELEPVRRLLTRMHRSQRAGSATPKPTRAETPPLEQPSSEPAVASTPSREAPQPWKVKAAVATANRRLSPPVLAALAVGVAVILLVVWLATRGSDPQPAMSDPDPAETGTAASAVQADPTAADTASSLSGSEQEPRQSPPATPTTAARSASELRPAETASPDARTPRQAQEPANDPAPVAPESSSEAASPAATESPTPASTTQPATATAQSPAPRPPTAATDRQQAIREIRETLIAYQAAWRALDQVAINALHPSAGLGRRDVETYTASEIVFEECAPTIETRSATLECGNLVHALTVTGGGTEMRRYRGVRLRKVGDRWLIESLY